MRHMKKIASFLLAAIMVLAMVVPTFADETKYTITVSTSSDTSAHTYKVYQIFTGTPESGKLVDVKYGSSYTPSGKSAGDAVPKADLDALTDARAFASSIKNSLGAEVATLTGTNPTYQAVPGYYLILDTAYTASADSKDAYSAFMLQVVDKNTTFTPKKSTPSVTKEVKDEAADKDTASTDSEGWGKTADHAIGETFQFKLTANIPADANLKYYTTYKVQFNDTMSVGVTFEKINSVKVNGTAIDASAYTCTATAGQAGSSWTLTIADIKQISGVQLGDATVTIVVEYDAHLNTAAAVNKTSGSTTNQNDVSLTYSNNPDATGSGDTDTTPKDSAWVFTYEVDNNKVDANDVPVSGAKFQLYTGSTEGTTKPTGTLISLYKKGTDYYVYDSAKSSEYTDGEVVTEMETTSTGVFNIKGLDDGTYTLYESGVPGGYVQATNTIVKISAGHTTNAGAPQVTLDSTSTMSNKIVNLTGQTLPTTGGIGTTIFYVLGSILVLGAVILLATRRRMSR